MKKLKIFYSAIFFTQILLVFQKAESMNSDAYSLFESITILSEDDSCTITDATLLNDQQIAASLSNGTFSVININPLSVENVIPISKSKIIQIDSIQRQNLLATIDENSHVVVRNTLENTVRNYAPDEVFCKEQNNFARGYGSLCLLENGNIVIKQKFEAIEASFANQGTLLSFIDTKKEMVKHKIAPVYPIDKMITLPGDRCLALVNKKALQIFDFSKKEVQAPIVFEFSEPIADFNFLQDPLSENIKIAATSFHGLVTFLELSSLHKKITAKFIGEKKTGIKKINTIVPLNDSNVLFIEKNKKIYLFNLLKNKVIQKIKDEGRKIASVIPLKHGNFIVIYKDGRLCLFEKGVMVNVIRTKSMSPFMGECNVTRSHGVFFDDRFKKSSDQRRGIRSDKSLLIEEETREIHSQEIFAPRKIESFSLLKEDEILDKGSYNAHLKGYRFLSALTPLVDKDEESEKYDTKEEAIEQLKRKIKIIKVDSDPQKKEKVEESNQ